MNTGNKMIPVNQESSSGIDELCSKAIDLLHFARGYAAKQVNLVQLMTYYSLGRWIVEEQQRGQSRAMYGQQVMRRLSQSLTEQFGTGFSVDTLENARKFYLTYRERISEPLFRKFAIEKSEPLVRNSDASKYELYLPDKKLLQEKLEQWIEEESGGENI